MVYSNSFRKAHSERHAQQCRCRRNGAMTRQELLYCAIGFVAVALIYWKF